MNGKALPHSAGVALSYQMASCLREIEIHTEVKNVKDGVKVKSAGLLFLPPPQCGVLP